SQTSGRSRSTIPADEITLNGIPFQTAASPPPRNVGTPDSAETPAPARTRTFFALLKRCRSSSETEFFVAACMLQTPMVAKCPAKSQFRDLSLIQYNTRLLLSGGATEKTKHVVPPPSGSVRVRVLAPKQEKTIFFRLFVATPLTQPSP